MGTLSKIFITIIFVLSAVFLGFSIAEVSQKDDNPKYQYMRQLRLRKIAKFDINRLQKNIMDEQGAADGSSIGSIGETLKSMENQYLKRKDKVKKYDEETKTSIENRDKILSTLTDIEKEVSNFVSSMKAYKLTIESFIRKNDSLIYSYQDVLRQYESLATEYMRMQLEYQKLSEEHRAISDAFVDAQSESEGLTDSLAIALTKNPDLENLSRDNGRLLEGVVQSAGEPPSGVVLISIGSNEGLGTVRGQRFSVLRDGEFIAKIKVIKVMPNSAIALVETPYQNVRILPGDIVRRSLILPTSKVDRNR